MERQTYYRDLIGYLVEKYYSVMLDASKHAEAPLPNTRIDMRFDIPGESLSLGTNNPLSTLKEFNIVHIKAVNDRLTKDDIVQYLGELYVFSNRAKSRENIALTIVSAEKVSKNITQGIYHTLEKTDTPWIYELKAAAPAYIFVLDQLPKEEKYLHFFPFQSLTVIEESKEFINKSVEKMPDVEKVLFLYWLRKLQPDFYNKEIEMPIDMEEVVKELCPNSLLKAEEKKAKEIALNLLRKKMNVVEIAEATGLSKEEITKLKKEHNL